MTRRSICLFACLLALVLTTAPVAAQDYRAKVQGTVSDASQAVIPSVKVTLTNENTGVSATRETNPQGQFVFDFVEPGTYTVTVESAGFNKFTQKGIQVQVRADVTVDPVLQVSGVAETVEVTGQVAQVQFNSTTMELTINQKMLKDLPVLARNPFTLALLDPAVVNRYTTTRNPFFMWAASTVEVGGNTNRSNDLFIDGTPVQIGAKGSYSPPMDAVQEFSVQQNSVDAEFGHSSGGVMSVGMKAGTNEFHGTASYFGRNPKFNAVTNSITHAPNMVRNHIWGGTLGNPIIKNKLFTFTAYEQWKTKEPYSTIRTLPTDLERRGDFSRSLNASGGLRTIYDPWSTKFDAATNSATRTPFAGNVIPQNRIDSSAARFMQDIWAPNGPGDDITGVNNYKKSYFWTTEYYNFSERVDWNISDNLRMFGRYSRVKTTLATFRYVDSPAMKDDNAGLMNNRNIAVDTVWVKDAKTVFNFRAGYASLEDDYDAPPAKVTEQKLGDYWPNNPWYKPYVADLPAIYYPLLSVANSGGEFGMGWYWWQHPKHYSAHASVRRSEGAHSLKFGMETRFHRAKGHYPELMSFNFSPNYTADTFLSPNTKLSGDSWATFLLGAIDNNSYARYVSPQNVALNYYAGYFHDDFRLNRNITLNLGIRWEHETGPVEEKNRFSRYLDLTDPIPEFQGAGAPAIPADIMALRKDPLQYNGAWVYTDENNRQMFKTDKFAFSPRLGIAVRLNDKSALHVGFARYIAPPLSISNTLGDIPMFGFHQRTDVAPSVEGIPGASLSNPYPASNPIIMPVGKSRGRYTNLGDAVNWNNQDLRTTTNDRINVSLQRQLPFGYSFAGTFFTNIGRDLPYSKALNMSDPALSYQHKGLLTQAVPNPYYQLLTPDKFPGSLRNQKTVTRGSLLRPYPLYGNLTLDNVDARRNRYYSMQLKLQKEYSAGYTLLATYNYNREYSDELFNPDDQYANRFTMIQSRRPRHRMNFAGTYDFPFGKGRRFLAGIHPIANAILGGWSTSSILMINTGEFLYFNAMQAEGGNPRIDNPTRDKYFDTSKFKVLPPYTPRTNPWFYPGVVGPAYWQLDSALSKTFAITERYRLEFKAEAYNLTNSFMASLPNMSVTSSLFGRSTGQANKGREMQYSLRLQF